MKASKNVVGRFVRTIVRDSGKSHVVNLPYPWLSAMGLKKGDKMTISVLRDGSLVLRPIFAIYRTENEKPEAARDAKSPATDSPQIGPETIESRRQSR